MNLPHGQFLAGLTVSLLSLAVVAPGRVAAHPGRLDAKER